MPGGQVLGPTFDYTHRLLDFALAAPQPPREASSSAPATEARRWRTGSTTRLATRAIRHPVAARDRAPRPRGPDRDRSTRAGDRAAGDLTRDPLRSPRARDVRLQMPGARRRGLPARAGLLHPARLRAQPIPSPARSAWARSRWRSCPRSSASPIEIGDIVVTECEMVNQFEARRRRRRSSRAATAWPSARPSARRWPWRWSTARCDAASSARSRPRRRRTRSSCSTHADNVEASGFVQHLKLPHYVTSSPSWCSSAAARGGDRSAAAAEAGRGARRSRSQPRTRTLACQLRLPRRADQAHDPPRAAQGGGHPRPPGAVRLREMPLPYGWGTGGIQVTASVIGPDDVLKVIDQGADDTTNAVTIRRFFARTAGVRTTDAHARGDADPDAPPHPRDAAARRPDHRLPGAAARAAALAGAARRRDAAAACAARTTALMHVKLYEDIAPARPRRDHLRLSGARERPLPDGALADPEVRQPQDAPMPGAAAVRRRPREAASTPCRRYTQCEPGLRGPPVRPSSAGPTAARCAAATDSFLDEVVDRRRGGRLVRLLRHRLLREPARGRTAGARERSHRSAPCSSLGSHSCQALRPRGSGCRDVSLRAVAGRGAGRGRRVGLGQDHRCSNCSGRRAPPTAGSWSATLRDGSTLDVHAGPRRCAGASCATDWGFVHQNPRDGLRMGVERRRQRRRAADGGRRAPLRRIRGQAHRLAGRAWSSTPPASTTCRAPSPAACSSACRSRATWSRDPRLVFMDEPTGGPRRLGAGAAAGPAPRAGAATWTSRRSS